MNTSDIADTLYHDAQHFGGHLTRKQARALTDNLLASIADALIAGEDVRLNRIGTLHVHKSSRANVMHLPTVPKGTVFEARPTVKIRASNVIRRALVGD